MASTPVSANQSLPAPAGAAVVPGVSAGASTAPAAPAVPVAPGTGVAGGGGGAAVDPAQLLVLLTTLLTLLKQMPGLQGAQLGAAGVQGGGGGAVPLGGPSFGPTTMGTAGAIGATAINSNPFGGSFGATVGGVSLAAATGTTTSLSNGSVPSFLPSLGTITGGGGSFGAPAAGPSFAPTTLGSFSAISPSFPTTATLFGTAGFGTSTVGGVTLGATPGASTAPVAGGGAAAAPAATPQIDMRRVLGSPRSGDVIDTIIRSAVVTAQPSKSEGQYIVIQDANGAQLQAHVHGAWSAHPTRIAEGIQRGFIQVHVHEDGTLHLHDVV